MSGGKSRVMSRRLMWLSLACAVLYFPGMPCAAANIRLALVTHSPDNDPWWRVVKNAMRDADEDFGVTTDYMNPPHGDVNDMKNILIKLANHSGYDGVISTIGTLGPIKTPAKSRKEPAYATFCASVTTAGSAQRWRVAADLQMLSTSRSIRRYWRSATPAKRRKRTCCLTSKATLNRMPY